MYVCTDVHVYIYTCTCNYSVYSYTYTIVYIIWHTIGPKSFLFGTAQFSLWARWQLIMNTLPIWLISHITFIHTYDYLHTYTLTGKIVSISNSTILYCLLYSSIANILFAVSIWSLLFAANMLLSMASLRTNDYN